MWSVTPISTNGVSDDHVCYIVKPLKSQDMKQLFFYKVLTWTVNSDMLVMNSSSLNCPNFLVWKCSSLTGSFLLSTSPVKLAAASCSRLMISSRPGDDRFGDFEWLDSLPLWMIDFLICRKLCLTFWGEHVHPAEVWLGDDEAPGVVGDLGDALDVFIEVGGQQLVARGVLLLQARGAGYKDNRPGRETFMRKI